MANFKEAFDTMLKLEFNSPKNALHTNPGEDGFTFCGIYQKANPNWSGWNKIEKIIKEVVAGRGLSKALLKQASEIAYNNEELKLDVEELYKQKYWTPFRLDELNQTASNEIFIFGVNAGMKTAIKKAQKVAGTVTDGIIGPNTIKAINSISENNFDLLFDEEEIKYYDSLIKNKPSFAVFKNGWHNRAQAV